MSDKPSSLEPGGQSRRPKPADVLQVLKPHEKEAAYVQALRRHAQRYLKQKNVTSVGVGYKIKGAEPTGTLSIQFTVEKKFVPEALVAEGLTKLPETITTPEGEVIPVDVVERKYERDVNLVDPQLQAATPRRQRRDRLNPIRPGLSVGLADSDLTGTIGGIVFDEKTGAPMILSNWHVLQGAQGNAGDAIVQPGPLDAGDTPQASVGKLVRSHLGLAGDCAVCSIEGRQFDRRILELNVVPERLGKVQLGDRLVKSGRTTGVTFGVVSRVGVVSKIRYEGQGEIEIGGFEVIVNADKPPANGEVSMGGDSGSFWMMDDPDLKDVVVGLHFAGESETVAAEFALACNIHSVLEKLHLRLTPAESTRASDVERLHRAMGLRGPAPRAAAPGAGDLPPLDLDRLAKIEDLLAHDPEDVLELIRETMDPKMDEDLLRHGLARARSMLAQPERFSAALEVAAEAARAELPPGFTFPGMDLDRIPIDPDNHQFEDLGDLPGWIIFAGGTILFGPDKAPFRFHDSGPDGSGFRYRLEDPTTSQAVEVALFGDFGTGLYHSRYIARQFEEQKFNYAIHLGDVYYAGRESEFREQFNKPLTPILGDTRLFMLNSNHEMFSGGKWYFDFIDKKRTALPARQEQEGSYFSLVSSRFQIVGIDTDYHKNGRFKEDRLREWLHQQLTDARANGRVAILLSANQPYEYGDDDLTKLFDKDLRDLAPFIDIWFWGNTHYCGLFDRTAGTPFIGSCVGHGGFPYKRLRPGKTSPAPLLFLETRARFPQSTNLRQDMGNNGYCRMSLHADGKITLRYADWMSNIRSTAVLDRDPAGGLKVISRESIE
ncbi:MAG: metallophosphoesterase [Acidobacteriota bacterium]